MCTLWTGAIVLFLCIQPTIQQRPFPPLFNVAKDKDVFTEPSGSTCGIPLRSVYCKSSTANESVQTCRTDHCIQTCPHGDTPPLYHELLPTLVSSNVFSCITMDFSNTRPRSMDDTFSVNFMSAGAICFLTPTDVPMVPENTFTVTAWVWLAGNPGSARTLLQKVNYKKEVIHEIQLAEEWSSFLFFDSHALVNVTWNKGLSYRTWTHLAIQVNRDSVSLYLNGTNVRYLPAETTSIDEAFKDQPGSYRIGQNHLGRNQFFGRVQDLRIYSNGTTNRDLEELYTGEFPAVRTFSDCRCPLTAPRINPVNTYHCIRNNLPDTTTDVKLRLNEHAHPLEYVNDGDLNSVWISKFQKDVSLVVRLGDDFEVLFVILTFYSPLPKAISIERKVGNAVEWETWQYYAEDCMKSYGYPNNGEILTPTSVNCLQLGSERIPIPYSNGDINFNLLPAEPLHRPGYDEFYKTPEIFNFVQANSIRVKFHDHFNVTNLRHYYFGVRELTVTARCNCNGHGSVCNTSTLPYTCQCEQDSFTQGRKCEECQPLYNDKSFRRGDPEFQYACKKCQCYGHADSCVYNATLDPFPDDYEKGGGGVCVDCKHNTAGRFCEQCQELHYREPGTSLYDENVCSPCNCNEDGVYDKRMTCNSKTGQCMCKEYVEGKRCDKCMIGYYNLTAFDMDGCSSCLCDYDGIKDYGCDQETAQCSCKKNTRNSRCNICEYGYYNLTRSNPDGCSPCNCNPKGSSSIYCDPKYGKCLCLENIGNRQCDECVDHYYDFEAKCKPCGCNVKGIEPGTICNKTSGQCVCKEGIQGRTCDECKDGYYDMGSSEKLGCLKCTCNPGGTSNTSIICDKVLGNCQCKANVDGLFCDTCLPGFWNLKETNALGCESCDCDPSGTQTEDVAKVSDLICDQTYGNCTCLANRIGSKCDDCLSGYYVNPEPGGGCLKCDCDAAASIPGSVCNSKTGQCHCRDPEAYGVTGKDCRKCRPNFYEFNAFKGSCSPCMCSTAGGLNTTCTMDGQCQCKEYVTGLRCETCVAGTSTLDETNPFGCSKAPTQQPPVSLISKDITTIVMEWKPPDYPNGIIKNYTLYRNGTELIETSSLTYKDENLHAYMRYSYVIEAANSHGSTRSPPVVFRTDPGKPVGNITLTVLKIDTASLILSWNEPEETNGPLLNYSIFDDNLNRNQTVLIWHGEANTAELNDLEGFSKHNFYVVACTSGGCLYGLPLYVTTPASPPSGMPPPTVTILSETELFVEWLPPKHPNGIIIFYELWMRQVDSDGNIITRAARIFHPSGMYNPDVNVLPTDNVLPPPATNFTVINLQPYTPYQFQVFAENEMGKAESPWVTSRTAETVPVYVPTPIVLGLNSSSLDISWREPLPEEMNGAVIQYKLFQLVKTDLLEDPYAPPKIWQMIKVVNGTVHSVTVVNLPAFSIEQFRLEACNSIGCMNSSEASGQTLTSAPTDMPPPFLASYNSSSIELTWNPPKHLNGPPPNYFVEKTTPSFNYSIPVIKGTRFSGGSYYLMPPSTVPENVEFTGVRMWFRMSPVQKNGMLMFAASPGAQDEFFCIQFKGGRPWFVFDAQGGARFATTTNDEGYYYNQNEWHHMYIRRRGKEARIEINGIFHGEPPAVVSTKGHVIGNNTGVYIGGFPKEFVLRRPNIDPRALIIRQGFSGCIRDLEILQQEHPYEVWKKVDWKDATAKGLASFEWDGCPALLDLGVHFLGRGYSVYPYGTFDADKDFEMSFRIRTETKEGLLVFAYGAKNVYVLIAIRDGKLMFEFSDGVIVSRAMIGGDSSVDICGGSWLKIKAEKTKSQASLTVVNHGSQMDGDPSVSSPIQIASKFYIGGVPDDSEAKKFLADLNLDTEGYGGCMADFKFGRNNFDFGEKVESLSSVNLDGCPLPLPGKSLPCHKSIVSNIYDGANNYTVDNELQPYSDYIYRVTAYNDEGSASSAWQYGKTKAGAPLGVLPPTAEALNGYEIALNWSLPESTSGLLSKYVLRVYNLETHNITEMVILQTDNTTALIKNLIPNTNYSIKLVACTADTSCTESEQGAYVKTPEEVPQGTNEVIMGSRGPTWISVMWANPEMLNGVITGYILYMEGKEIYAGGVMSFNKTGLQVYTSYQFSVNVCNRVGCEIGPAVFLTTAQQPPTFVDPPTLTVLGIKEIEAKWNIPTLLNGVLQRFLIQLSTNYTDNFVTVYNNSDLFTDTILTNLTAGTKYYIKVGACTEGGCTLSEYENATTEESSPEEVYPPKAESPMSSKIVVSWIEPGKPNGHITHYLLYHNGEEVVNDMVYEHVLENLQSYSLHSFRLGACTKEGCGYSTETIIHSAESQPRGYVVLEVKVNDARAVAAKWTQPYSPNGLVYYDVYFSGNFYVNPASYDFTTTVDRRSLYQNVTADEWVVISGLIPFSHYSVQVNASNTVGFIMSNIEEVDLPYGSPDGVKPPNLMSPTPTSITATWEPVGRINSPDNPHYELFFRETSEGAQVQSVFGPTVTTSFTMENLLPFVKYEFSLKAKNSIGSTRSEWVSLVTKQAAPTGFDPPLIVSIRAKSVEIAWIPPLKPNGIIMYYIVSENGIVKDSVPANQTRYTSEGLSPYTEYMYSLQVCTVAGCLNSANSSVVRTFQAAPEGIAPPTLESPTPTAVSITWTPPARNNGKLIQYVIERQSKDNASQHVVAVVPPEAVLSFLDESLDMRPYTLYHYRIKASTSAGVGQSNWAEVTTLSSRPSRVLPPTVTLLGISSMSVTWVPPSTPNGKIDFYEIRFPDPIITITDTTQLSVQKDDLVPYTDYSVTVTACTDRGCTESLPVKITTGAFVPQGQPPPVPNVVSQTQITVMWAQPLRPNGPNIRFELSRKKLRQPLTPNASDIGLWKQVYVGSEQFLEDVNLPVFTTYVYRVTVYNDIGQMTSNESTEATTFGGYPRKAPDVSATTLDYRTVLVQWTSLGVFDLQGAVEKYTVTMLSRVHNISHDVSADLRSTRIENLMPSTEYSLNLTLTINGGASISTDPIQVKTLDGVPARIIPPEVIGINDHSMRISWKLPQEPNGIITEYNILLDSTKIPTNTTFISSIVVSDLQPYTVYQVQLQACTKHGCNVSEKIPVTTAEALSTDLPAPQVFVEGPNTVEIRWSPPTFPNGVITQYEVWRRTIKNCSELSSSQIAEVKQCSYLSCQIEEKLCGRTCYSGDKVCCDGTVYDKRPGYQCCGNAYLLKSSPSLICCGEQFFRPRSGFECCGRRFVHVDSDSVCCVDTREDRVSIGKGDACCGTVPYFTGSSQICCDGKLTSRFGNQCCGKMIVSEKHVCCGGLTASLPYAYDSSLSCCGQKYINDETTLCCTSSAGMSKVYHYESSEQKASSGDKCCGMEKIHSSLSCCNFIGYNPDTHTCADRSPQQSRCGLGTVCKKSEEESAMCDRCNFDATQSRCYSTEPMPDGEEFTDSLQKDKCAADVDRIYAGLKFSYRDSVLLPFSEYDYAVVSTNKAGITRSEYTLIKTLEDVPEMVEPPTAFLDPDEYYRIYLSWKPPMKPNGRITTYSLRRDGLEIFEGLHLDYIDENNVLPFETYTYMLSACTRAGCTDSDQITIATIETAPDGMPEPSVTALSFSKLQVTWQQPMFSNGRLTNYSVYMNDVMIQSVDVDAEKLVTITDLMTYTIYSIYVEVCTLGGCASSTIVHTRTLPTFPTGILAPTFVVINATAVEIYWRKPDVLNGALKNYNLYRRQGSTWSKVHTGTDLSFLNVLLIPGKTYYYMVEVVNDGEYALNSSHSEMTLPTQTYGQVPPFTNITILGATEIYIAWKKIDDVTGIDQYRLVVNAGLDGELNIGTGLETFYVLNDLQPFTSYQIRLQVCLENVPNGCSTGSSVTVTTSEAVPRNMQAPSLRALSSTAVELSWNPPLKPNGIISSYRINYIKPGSDNQKLLTDLSGNSLSYNSTGLLPFSNYEFLIIAVNSEGNTSSRWARIRTPEGVAVDVALPKVKVISAFAVSVMWTEPLRPNGVVLFYHVQYRLHTEDPTVDNDITVITVPGSVTGTEVSGLIPYRQYDLRIEAENSAGRNTSDWVAFTTDQASPQDVMLIEAEKIKSGQAFILRWGVPRRPNGVITTYKIYEGGAVSPIYRGLNREFEVRNLVAYTVYQFQLEACTLVACTRAAAQKFRTSEVLPSEQSAPVFGDVNSTTVVIIWTKPVNPNGDILKYQVLRKSSTLRTKRQAPGGEVVYETTNTNLTNYQFIDTGLEPHTQYQYKIRTHNGAGFADSVWQIITTDQAPPEGIHPPIVKHVEDVTSLKIQWSPPEKNNGVIKSYLLRRNTSLPLSFSPSDPQHFTDENLTPYTLYSYVITVCTGGGCTDSQPTLIQTKETAPAMVLPPMISVLSSKSLALSWIEPDTSNGPVNVYHIRRDGQIVYTGMSTSVVISDLVPYNVYEFSLTACTSGGCTQSSVVNGRPSPDKPMGMDAPVLNILSSKSIEVSWLPPTHPNGIIVAYDVKRNGSLIYTESATFGEALLTTYIDHELNAGQVYTYSVIARNQIGFVESSAASAKTYASSPTGMSAPIAQALTSTSVVVSWRPPLNPSGSILNYTLYSRNQIVYSGGPDVLSYIILGLGIYTEYMYRVQACTKQGCVLSSSVSVRTLEAPPDGMEAPSLIPLADGLGKHIGVLVEWNLPARPGGRILTYELRRRRLKPIDGGLTFDGSDLIFSGLSYQYQDERHDLEPFTDYQYFVTAVNSAGKTSSQWSTVKTKEAPPSGLLPPVVDSTSATSITFYIEPPEIANGIVKLYSIVINNVEQGTASLEQTHTVKNLMPNTNYNAQAKVCTNGGCTTSNPITVTTLSTVPTGLQLPNVVSVTSQSVTLSWSYPTVGQLDIDSFLLYLRKTCPPTHQPFQQTCVVGAKNVSYSGDQLHHTAMDLEPYTAYEFLLEAKNQAGTSDSQTWLRVETLAAEPSFIEKPLIITDEHGVSVEWTNSFTLNGMLIESSVIIDDQSVYTGTSFQYYIQTASYSDNELVLKVLLQTNRGQAQTPDTTVNITRRNNNEQTTEHAGVTDGQVGESSSVLKEVWFIVLLCLLVLICLVILIAVCLRCCNSQRRYIREKLPLSQANRRSQKAFTLDVPIHDTISRVPRALSNKSLYPPYSRTSAMSITSPKKYSSSSSSTSSDSGAFNDLADMDLYSFHRGQLTLTDTISDSSLDGNRDSGLYDDDDDSLEREPNFSVSKERMIFTDTRV